MGIKGWNRDRTVRVKYIKLLWWAITFPSSNNIWRAALLQENILGVDALLRRILHTTVGEFCLRTQTVKAVSHTLLGKMGTCRAA